MSEVTKVNSNTPVYQIGNLLLTKAQVQQRIANITTQLAQSTARANADLEIWNNALTEILAIEQGA